MSDPTAFVASEPFAFFDYFRVPYSVIPSPLLPAGTGELRPSAAGTPRLMWNKAQERPARERHVGVFSLDGMTLAGSVVRDEIVRRDLTAAGDVDGWRPAEPVRSGDGRQVGSVWRDERDGSVLLPFDPGEIMATLWSERYRDVGRRALWGTARHLALRAYYLLRPALPRSAQLRLRRAFSRVQGRAEFPRWPIEDGLHDVYGWLFGLLADLAGQPVPWLDLWPDGRTWAMVLTHDVETDVGLRQLHLLRGPEQELGLRSSWNLVAERYDVGDDDIRRLQDDGCEIGVHGLRHDGRDLGSRRLLRSRLPAMRKAAARWNAEGFRSPATQRRWEWMPDMGFAYDSSSTDTDPYEPQPGGCCTVLPFFNRELVELPITLPQDHTLFAVLGASDGGVWLEKAHHIRERGGMALVLTHPDYASDPRVAGAYRELLATFHGDPDVWNALPREVASWWRRRSASSLVRAGEEWEIVGPAAGEGRVRFAGPSGPARSSTAQTAFVDQL